MQSAHSQAHTEKNIINLATPLLDVVMRLKAGGLQPSNDFRQRINSFLSQMEQQALSIGFKDTQIHAVKFALVAFTDEAVLAGRFHSLQDWGSNPLQLEHFGDALAGVKFFDRLDAMLKNPQQEAEVIEVYYLCLLLGFKGKYHSIFEDQLPGVIGGVEDKLRSVGRLGKNILAPHWLAKDQPGPPPPAEELSPWVKWTGAATLGTVALAYLIYNLILTSNLNSVKELLLR